jgi:transposase
MPKQPPAADCPETIEALKAEVVDLRAQVTAQAAQNAQLLQRIQELEARLGKDSHNSRRCI